MTMYERMKTLANDYETLLLHFMELNKFMCQLSIDVYGTGITDPKAYLEFQRLMTEKNVQ